MLTLVIENVLKSYKSQMLSVLTSFLGLYQSATEVVYPYFLPWPVPVDFRGKVFRFYLRLAWVWCDFHKFDSNVM